MGCEPRLQLGVSSYSRYKQWHLGKHQWTFLLGTNWTNFPVFEKLGFYRMDTPRGQKLFAKLNYTNEELRNEGIATGALDSPAVL